MKISNERNTYRLWLRKLAFAIIFTISIVLILVTKWFDNLVEGLTKYHFIIAIALAYTLISIWGYLRRPYFFYFSDNGEMLIFRYYPVSIFNQRKNSIEIPKKFFVKYEIRKFLLGTQEELIVYQHFRNKVAKYPPISLSAVDHATLDRIIASLDKHSRH
ncbi:MAG: hypothetical protein ACOYXB_02710 [Bacteroidota bacterium]